MSIVSVIVIALALGICNMLLFRRCGEAAPVRLSAGLLIVLGVTAVHVLLYYLGMWAGSLMSFRSPDTPDLYNDVNTYIFLGMTVIVAFKMLWPYLRRNAQQPVFDLRSGWSVLAMAVATGINVLLIGVGVGFVARTDAARSLWPLLIASFLLGYLGLMLGRQKVAMRPRRWMVLSCVLLLAAAVASLF